MDGKIKYTASLFLAYPLGAILRALPGKNLKHFFSFAIGLVLAQWIFGPDWIHTFISSAVTYLICMIAPPKYMQKIAFFWVMGYMTASHIYRMYVSYLSGVFDFTGTQMVLTMKLTSFAYNLYDGTYDHANIFKDNSASKDAKMLNDRRRFAITSLPNPLEYFGYIYCFTCLLAGPAFEYNDYLHSIDGTVFKKKQGKDDAIVPAASAPSSILPALFNLVLAVVCLVGHLVISAKYPIESVYNLEFIAATPHLPRYGYLWIALFAERLKYYFAWKIAEGASVMGGFGFEGYDADGKAIGWKGVENIDIISFETAPNLQTLSRAWNKRTQGWLERYTYHRSGKSLMMTYFVSAIWHGLYPGFFFFFMSIPILTNIERLIKAKINPLIVPAYDGRDHKTYPKTMIGYLYWGVSVVVTLVFVNYMVQVFNLSSYERCMTAWGSYYHAPHIFCFAVYALLELMPSKKPKSSAAAAKKAE